MDKDQNKLSIEIAIAWCLAWGGGKQPRVELERLRQMRQAMLDGAEVPEVVQSCVEQVRQLHELPYPETLNALKAVACQSPHLWDSKIGLVYGGATKIKQYVFEASKLPDIRGASALLDRINLVDIPAFFRVEAARSISVEQWLNNHFPQLGDALIPELLIYYKGGNILTFCPAGWVDDLADAIEKRYTTETLTANSCAVGEAFRLLELRFGLLKDPIEESFWLDKFHQYRDKAIVKAYFQQPDVSNPDEAFKNRKSFNELVGKLATRFNQRRAGCILPESQRPSRRFPPMFETHPYLVRDEGERGSAIAIVQHPGVARKLQLSESLARKKIVGQIAKREIYKDNLPQWFRDLELEWQPTGIRIKSWVAEFEEYLNRDEHGMLKQKYYSSHHDPEEARSLREIGNVSRPRGFVAHIYADGNNMGGYIQKIKTPGEYREFSEDIFQATESSVYQALAEQLQPRLLEGLSDPDNENRNGTWIHPFEILTIGGDDVMLIVPADKALAIAQTLGNNFERILLERNRERYRQQDPSSIQKSLNCHRYAGKPPQDSACKLSMSTGVLITAEDTPIYYARKISEQLLKSAKQYAKHLKQDGRYRYHGGTIDFLVMKAVTILSSKVGEFRKSGLEFGSKPKLKLYGAPYTLHEIEGLLETAKALKEANFPRSQLYQIRSLLEQGKRTAMLNYRYFWSRLNSKEAKAKLKQEFEDAWCKAKTNQGNLVPWMYVEPTEPERQKPDYSPTYETIWRELVDLYPFIDGQAQAPEMPTEANAEVG